MNGRNFAAKRARIRNSNRPERTQRRALEHLAREAGAQPGYVGGKLIGHMMPSGTIVCELRRFPTEEVALEEVRQAHRFAHLRDNPVPVRAFWCPHCYGFHLSKRV